MVVQLQFSLSGHNSNINTVAINPEGETLLSGDALAMVKVWSLSDGQCLQTFERVHLGSITTSVWVKMPDLASTSTPGFVIGTSQGCLELFLFSEKKKTFVHRKTVRAHHHHAVESLVFDPHHHRVASTGAGSVQMWSLGSQIGSICKLGEAGTVPVEPYEVCRAVGFREKGEDVLVTYTESHSVVQYTVEPWTEKWDRTTATRIGYATLDGEDLFVSNLEDGVDRYIVRSMERTHSYRQRIDQHMSLPVALVNEGKWVVVGGDDSHVRIYKRNLDTQLVQTLEHKDGGRIRTLVTHDGPRYCLIVAASTRPPNGPATIQVWRLDNQEPRSAEHSWVVPRIESNGWSRFQPWIIVLCLVLLLLWQSSSPYSLRSPMRAATPEAGQF
ncbi:WD40-repeat-containing domain protein [Mycena floridula]|nr:WD40-repeat-containing domain protein [Mycena floridula]